MTEMKENQAKARLVVRDVKDAVTELCARMDETLAEVHERVEKVLNDVTGKLAHIGDVRSASDLLRSYTQHLLAEGGETGLITAMNAIPDIRELQLQSVVARIPKFNDVMSDFLKYVRNVNRKNLYVINRRRFCVAENMKPWQLEYVNEVVKDDFKVTGLKFNSPHTELVVRTTDPDSTLHCFRFSSKHAAFTLLRHFSLPEINNWSRPLELDSKRSLVLTPCGRNGLYRIETDTGNIESRIPSYNMDYSDVCYNIVTDVYVITDEQTGRLILLSPVTRQILKLISNREGSPSLNTSLACLSPPYQLAVSLSSHHKIHVYDITGEVCQTIGPEVLGVGPDIPGAGTGASGTSLISQGVGPKNQEAGGQNPGAGAHMNGGGW